MGGGGGSSQYIPTPTSIPGATDVSRGTSNDSESVMAKALERQRKRRGISSTYRSTATDNPAGTTGKTRLGD